MEALQNRIDSFSKSKRVKRSSKSSKTTVKWPHPLSFKANPEALAEAGLYYNPTAEDRDMATCFECAKQWSEWEEDDDPFDLHWAKCGDKCSWAAVRCGLREDMDRHGRFTFPDKTRLPGSERMEKARLGTFNVGDGWMHDQIKDHGANSRKMAQAGFAWTPQLPGDDLATCLYCNISLSGWEKDDDPMEEHRKRVKVDKPCPFLAHASTNGLPANTITSSAAPPSMTNNLTRSASTKPPSRAQSKPASRSKSSRLTQVNKVIITEKDGDDARGEVGDDVSDPVPTVRLVQKPAGAKKTRKISRAPSAQSSTRRTTRSESSQPVDTQHAGKTSHGNDLGKSTTLRDVEEEDEVSDKSSGQQNQPVSEIEEQTRTRSRSRASQKPSKTRGKVPRKKSSRPPASQQQPRTQGKVATDEVKDVVDNITERPELLFSDKGEDLSRSQASHELLKAREGNICQKDPVAEEGEETAEDTPERSQRHAAEVEESRPLSRSHDSRKQPKPREKVATGILEEIADSIADRPELLFSEEGEDLSRPHASHELPSPKARGNLHQKEQDAEGKETAEDTPKRSQRHAAKVEESHPISHSHASEKQPKLREKAATDAVEDVTNDVAERLELHLSEEDDQQSHSHTSHKPRETKGGKATFDDIAEQPKRHMLAEDEEYLVSSSSRATHRPLDISQKKGEDVATEEAGEVNKGPKHRVSKQPLTNEVKEAHQKDSEAVIGPKTELHLDDDMTAPSMQIDKVQPDMPIQKKSSPAAELVRVQANSATTPVAKEPEASASARPPPERTPAPPSTPIKAKTTPEPQVWPALSRIPFMPLQTLTEAELDMTVEEWIRYQMEIEYDKLKRDGERELARFKARAEEVRSVIENL